MKAIKVRELTPEELQQQLSDAQGELENLHIRKGTRQLEQPSRLRALRRDIARMKTIVQERAQSAR